MYNNHDEAMGFLTRELVGRGIVDAAAVDAEIKSIVSLIPPTTREAYGDDDAVAAANFYDTYMGSQKAPDQAPVNVQTGSAVVPAKKDKVVFTAPALPDAAMDKVKGILESNQEQRIRATAQTSIKKVLTANPKPSEYLKDQTVIPECAEAKLAEYEKKLVKTEENIKAFNAIKEAVGKKALPVYLNDKNVKVTGVQVVTPANGQGKTETELLTLTNEHLVGFLVTRVMGRIPNEPVVGVELRTITPVTKGRKSDATAVVGRPNIKWVGRAAALKDANMHEPINEVAKTGQKVETKEGRLRIADSFQIIADKKNADGSDKIQTIRLSGKVSAVPKLKRRAEFKSIFGEISDGQTISAYLSDAEKAAAMEQTIKVMQAAGNNALVGGTSIYGSEFNNIIKQIAEASKAGAAHVATNFED